VSNAVDSTLLVFTGSYPFAYAVEDTFLEPELHRLTKKFDSVVVAPFHRSGTRASVPSNVKVEEGLAELAESTGARWRFAAKALVSAQFWNELRVTRALIGRPRALVRLLAAATRAEMTRYWLVRYFRSRRLAPAKVIAYTFWCDGTTTGLTMAKSHLPGLTVVSRAHGNDLYVERHDPPHLPLRTGTFKRLDRLYPDSERGLNYVVERYPWFASRCELARLGVPEPGFRSRASDDGSMRLISCSRIVPVKRVELILQAIEGAARMRPDVRFEWHHFGEGPLKAEVERLATSLLPANVVATFPGYEGLPELMAFYRNHPIDAFINASVSEGTPVSIMEAASCGIPVIATAVGGNTEIVSSRNGYLVGANPEPRELAEAILHLHDHPDEAVMKRAESHAVWGARYNADTNYAAFAAQLAALEGVGQG
jgi:glycosyltransferase involved in cell wall biosynthesis